MREGAAAGVTTPRVLVERALAQIEALMPDDVTKSSLWKPVLRFPASIDAETRTRLEADYRRVLVDEMFPAVRRLATFVRDDYLPKARTTDGFGALPNGDGMYRFSVRSETTTDLTPNEIHALGLSEVKRIQASYLTSAEKAGFSGRVSEVRGWPRGKPENHPFTSSDQVIEHLNRIHARIVPRLPTMFGRLPKAGFAIRLTDPTVAATTPCPVSFSDRRRSPRYLRDAGRRPAPGLERRPRRATGPQGHARTPFRNRHQTREQGTGIPPPNVDRRLRRGLGAIR
jgi:uncharacterized protein (DUF885 family)